MKITRSELRALLLREVKSLLKEAIEEPSLPDTPTDYVGEEEETPGWYMDLVDVIGRLYQNDKILQNQINKKIRKS